MSSAEIKERLHSMIESASQDQLDDLNEYFSKKAGHDWWDGLPEETRTSFKKGQTQLRGNEKTENHQVMKAFREKFLF